MNRVVVLLLGSLAMADVAHAGYSYVQIASPGVDELFVGTVNNSGEVAFTRAGPPGAAGGVYKGSGGALTTIALFATSSYSLFRAPFINCAGEVTFREAVPANGVYRGDGGARTTIYTDPSDYLQVHGINDHGRVVFTSLSLGLLTGDGGAPMAEIPVDDNIFPSSADINNAGTVVFEAGHPPGHFSAYTIEDGLPVQVVSLDAFPYADATTPRINNHGRLIWLVDLMNGGQAIQTRMNGVTSVLMDTAGPYASLGYHDVALDLNDYDKIAFSASVDFRPGLGIYVGPDPVADRVIEPGDALAGKVVSSAFVGGLNERGQISFRAVFSDGTSGVFRADPDVMTEAPVCLAGAAVAVPALDARGLVLLALLLAGGAVILLRRRA